MKKIKQGYFSVEFFELNNNITEQCVEYLEKSITEKPEFWLWSHNRFCMKKVNCFINYKWNGLYLLKIVILKN